MGIQLTKEQYQMLLKALMVGESVYGILGDCVSEEYKKESDELEELSKYILARAGDFELADLTEEYMGCTIPSDMFSEDMRIVMDDYDDETFWHELETRLGKRDFGRDMTDEERKEADKTGWLPDRVHEFYEKWSRELEKHGVERFGIVKGRDDEK